MNEIEKSEKKKIAAEYLSDPKFYLEHFTKIKGKSVGSLIPFKINNVQKDLFNGINDFDRLIICKSRQLGYSTGVVGNFYHRTIVTPATNTAIIGYNGELTSELLDKVKTFWRTTPSEVRPGVHYNSKHEMSFPNLESKIIVLPSSETVGRGYTLHNCLHAETKVLLPNKKWVPICTLVEGDVVIDGDGMPNRVRAVRSKRSYRPLRMIISEGCPASLRVTDDHKVLTLMGGEPEMVKSSDLSMGGFVAFPINTDHISEIDSSKGTVDGKYRWHRITRIFELPPETSDVWDLSLENEPYSFVTDGGIVHNCLMTEYAFWTKAIEKRSSLEASVPINGKIVIESSPSSVGTDFHRLWVTEGSGYERKAYGWWWGYTKEEIEIIRKRINDDKKFRREYCLEFDSSGLNIFDRDTIRSQRANVRRIGDVVELEGGGKWTVSRVNDLTIFRPPEMGKSYVLGADASEGLDGGDFATVSIFDRANGEQVAFWRGLVPPDVFGEMIDRWGRYYNCCLAVPEVNNHGLTTLTILKQRLYPNLFFRPAKYDTPDMPMSARLGWKTTTTTKALLIDDMVTACRNGEVKLRAKEVVDEMETFVYDDRMRARAMDGFHDDAIISVGLAIQGFKVTFVGDLSQPDYTRYISRTSLY